MSTSTGVNNSCIIYVVKSFQDQDSEHSHHFPYDSTTTLKTVVSQFAAKLNKSISDFNIYYYYTNKEISELEQNERVALLPIGYWRVILKEETSVAGSSAIAVSAASVAAASLPSIAVASATGSSNKRKPEEEAPAAPSPRAPVAPSQAATPQAVAAATPTVAQTVVVVQDDGDDDIVNLRTAPAAEGFDLRFKDDYVKAPAPDVDGEWDLVAAPAATTNPANPSNGTGDGA